MDVLGELGRYGGVAKRSQLARTDAERLALRDACTRGTVRDLGGGWVATAGASRAVVAARRFGGTVTCVSAASCYGLRTLAEPERPHVAVPKDRGRRRSAEPVLLHRERRWASPRPHDLPIAPLAEVIGRVLRCRPLPEAVVMVDAALHKRIVTVEQIALTLTGPGGPAARAALERCDRRSRSVIETLARLALQDAGLYVEAGVTVDGVGEVDLVVEGVVVVECDGFAYHSGRHEYREDRRRDRALVAKGYVPLRFTWEEIIKDPRVVVDAALRALGRL